MKIFDISLTIAPNLPVWPGDPAISLPRVSKMEEGAVCNVTRLDIGAHTGTHVDAPFHFLANGATVESLDLDILIGPTQVIELPDVFQVTRSDLEKMEIPQQTNRLLIKTRNSNLWAGFQAGAQSQVGKDAGFNTNYVGIQNDAAEWLVEHGIRLIGVDYLSVAPFEDTVPTHQTLLNASVIILEGLNLSAVSSGEYYLYCLPLKLLGSDGAPARAVLIQA